MSYYVANHGGTSYSGPFTTYDDARYHEDSGRRMSERLYGSAVTGRAVTRSRRTLILAAPNGGTASITADRRGLGHYSDKYPVVMTINYR
jgi:hypothetical protein